MSDSFVKMVEDEIARREDAAIVAMNCREIESLKRLAAIQSATIAADANSLMLMGAARAEDQKTIASLKAEVTELGKEVIAWKKAFASVCHMPEPELEPCPFCGGHAALSSDDSGIHQVQCMNDECLAQGPPSCEGADHAIYNWNERPASRVTAVEHHHDGALMGSA